VDRRVTLSTFQDVTRYNPTLGRVELDIVLPYQRFRNLSTNERIYILVSNIWSEVKDKLDSPKAKIYHQIWMC
jgi:hypothetical protein